MDPCCLGIILSKVRLKLHKKYGDTPGDCPGADGNKKAAGHNHPSPAPIWRGCGTNSSYLRHGCNFGFLLFPGHCSSKLGSSVVATQQLPVDTQSWFRMLPGTGITAHLAGTAAELATVSPHAPCTAAPSHGPWSPVRPRGGVRTGRRRRRGRGHRQSPAGHCH